MYFPLTVWTVGLLVLHEPVVKEEDVVLIVAYLELYGASPNGKQQPVNERHTCLLFYFLLPQVTACQSCQSMHTSYGNMI